MQDRGNTRGRIALFIVAAIIAVGVATAWVVETRSPSSGSGSDDPYSVRVVRDGKTLASFDTDDLRSIGSKRVLAQGKYAEGPQVIEVLKRAGVSTFVELTVIGAGVRDEGRLVLARAEVTPDVVLDLAEKRGTAKVAGPAIPFDKRVRDVTELRVR